MFQSHAQLAALQDWIRNRVDRVVSGTQKSGNGLVLKIDRSCGWIMPSALETRIANTFQRSCLDRKFKTESAQSASTCQRAVGKDEPLLEQPLLQPVAGGPPYLGPPTVRTLKTLARQAAALTIGSPQRHCTSSRTDCTSSRTV